MQVKLKCPLRSLDMERCLSNRGIQHTSYWPDSVHQESDLQIVQMPCHRRQTSSLNRLPPSPKLEKNMQVYSFCLFFHFWRSLYSRRQVESPHHHASSRTRQPLSDLLTLLVRFIAPRPAHMSQPVNRPSAQSTSWQSWNFFYCHSHKQQRRKTSQWTKKFFRFRA